MIQIRTSGQPASCPCGNLLVLLGGIIYPELMVSPTHIPKNPRHIWPFKPIILNPTKARLIQF